MFRLFGFSESHEFSGLRVPTVFCRTAIEGYRYGPGVLFTKVFLRAQVFFVRKFCDFAYVLFTIQPLICIERGPSLENPSLSPDQPSEIALEVTGSSKQSTHVVAGAGLE